MGSCMSKGKVALYLFLPLVMLMGCKTQRTIIKDPIREEGAEYLISQLKKNEARFEALTARFSATMVQDNKDRTSFSGQMRIKRDSLIWMSISPALGIEAVRLVISQDSIFLLNRINKTYLKTDFSFINGVINAALDYDMLQAFLIGNDFAFYEIGKFRASIDGMQYRLTTSNRNKIKKYIREHQDITTIPLQTIWLDPGTFKISHVSVKELEVEGRKLNAYYSGFEVVNNTLFPTKIKIDVSAEKKMDLDLEYSRIDFDADQTFPFKIPSSYTPMQ